MGALQTYLYKIQPVRHGMLLDGGTEFEQQIIGEHANYLKSLVDEGVGQIVGRTTNTDYTSFGMMIFQAESDEHAQKILDNDPAIAQRVMRGEVYPFRVVFNGYASEDT